jgi:hypothetical protein
VLAEAAGVDDEVPPTTDTPSATRITRITLRRDDAFYQEYESDEYYEVHIAFEAATSATVHVAVSNTYYKNTTTYGPYSVGQGYWGWEAVSQRWPLDWQGTDYIYVYLDNALVYSLTADYTKTPRDVVL